MPEEKKEMKKEEDKTEENIDLKIRSQRLRELLKKEENLRVRTDDNFMLRYLRCSQYDPEEAFKKMKNYYSVKKQYPQWFETAAGTIGPFASHQESLSSKSNFVLDDRDRFGKSIYINKLGHINTSKTTMWKQSQLHDLFIESVLDEKETQLNGISIIIDLKNYSWSLLRWLTPSNLCTAVKKIEALPFKKLEIHVVNTSFLLNASLKLILPFLSQRTKDNLHFHHDNWPSLHKIIDPENLPIEYGGKKYSFNEEKLVAKLYNNVERLKENLDLGYDVGH